MKKVVRLVGFPLLVIFTGCTEFAPKQTEEQEAVRVENTQNYLMASTLFVQHAAEYNALCHQAYNVAKAELLNRVGKDAGKSAVVLDLDETVLDNSAYSAWQVSSGNAFSPETWDIWTDMATAPEVPGAGSFLQFADSLGVTLFYVSNRDTSALSATIKNMRDLSMPQLEVNQFMLKTTTSGKEDRRAQIENDGYEIVMLIGDNLGDFHEQWDRENTAARKQLAERDQKHFGAKYIVLPNPIYGTWEGALYNYDRSWSDAQRDSIRKAVLQPAAIGK